MNRQPVYHERVPDLRVVSRANGLWQAQRLRGKSTREHDAWEPLHPAADYQTAKSKMDASAS